MNHLIVQKINRFRLCQKKIAGGWFGFKCHVWPWRPSELWPKCWENVKAVVRLVSMRHAVDQGKYKNRVENFFFEIPALFYLVNKEKERENSKCICHFGFSCSEFPHSQDRQEREFQKFYPIFIHTLPLIWQEEQKWRRRNESRHKLRRRGLLSLQQESPSNRVEKPWNWASQLLCRKKQKSSG